MERLHQLIPHDKQVAELLCVDCSSVAKPTPPRLPLNWHAKPRSFSNKAISIRLWTLVNQIAEEVTALKIIDFSVTHSRNPLGTTTTEVFPFICPDHVQITRRIHKLGFRSGSISQSGLRNTKADFRCSDAAPWSRLPNPTHLGLPFKIWRPQGFEIEVKNIPPWHECLTAIGLALHGIGSARFPIDLTPRETNLFGKLGLTLGRRSSTSSAWGVCVDGRGLIAVLLSRLKPKHPLSHCGCRPH
ncbi:MAG: hypothetical protein R3C28_19165 [Pirellulaceae bacterium]